MVRDDFEACLQAYLFAELMLGGLPEKAGQERKEALEAAQHLRDEVEPRYEAAIRDERRRKAEVDALKTARARLDESLRRYQ